MNEAIWGFSTPGRRWIVAVHIGLRGCVVRHCLKGRHGIIPPFQGLHAKASPVPRALPPAGL